MKTKSSFFRFAALIIPLVFLFSACELEVPIQEMTDAKTAINAAKAVDADRHSPDEMKKAEEMLLQCNTELSDEKADDARASALLAIEAAKNARTKALPLFAQEKMTASEEAYNEAEKLYAARFSPEKFNRAGELNNEAGTAYRAEDYIKAAELADEARTLANEASGDCLDNSYALQNELSEAGSRLLGLKSDSMADKADSELKSASDALALANDSMERRDYRTAYDELDKTKAALDRAESAIKKAHLSSEITGLREKMDAIKSGTDSQAVSEDLDKAMMELNAAETALEQDNIDDASMRVASARELIDGTDVKLKRKNALSALEKAENMLNSAREKDTGNKYTENLDSADTLITDGKALADQEKFNEALSNADEAETIIAAVLNSLEEPATDTSVATTDGDGELAVIEEKTDENGKKYYVVQWRKKNTDCLWRISEKVYNDASLWPLIYVANRDQIKNPDLIFPGQKFEIPPKPDKKPDRKELREMLKKKTSETESGDSGK